MENAIPLQFSAHARNLPRVSSSSMMRITGFIAPWVTIPPVHRSPTRRFAQERVAVSVRKPGVTPRRYLPGQWISESEYLGDGGKSGARRRINSVRHLFFGLNHDDIRHCCPTS